MTAAIAAARNGARVRLWEKNHSLGRKLLATGNGHCNLANADLSPGHFHSGRPDAVASVLVAFDLERTLKLFRGVGIVLRSDERGRFFPMSNEAGSVLTALEYEMGRLGVEVRTRCDIVGMERKGRGFLIHQRGEGHQADRVIVACGGCASPQFGSNGSGFELARQLGHKITELRPALVPWEIFGNWFHTLQGIRWDMELTVKTSDGRKAVFLDEGLFTKYGFSGPLALRSSRQVGDGIKSAHLNFMPGKGAGELGKMLEARRENLKDRPAGVFFSGLLPEKIGRMLVRESGVMQDNEVGTMTDAELAQLAGNMIAWPVRIKGLRPFKEAQVTAGGVDMSQVAPGTLESKLAPGLFFCGEVLDVDGDSGGYNLQWCWSSGWAAGTAAARSPTD